ncbi:cadherin-like beta sandwich domain-containing protein, partial [Acutalibacter sp. 1XD8-36]|uniref:cadherin-like beta sandwich domain-containing protein n=1 Tax=Acutalibacter sp. 1XD8-36 TaxID=2320852 RepID=UPI0014134B27
KFLKRPLAALLAILMVVALVPMSAFAAEPDVIKVGGEEVKLGDGTATVGLTLPSGTSGIVENTLKALQFELRSDNGTTVGILDKDGKMIGTSLLGRPDISTAKKTVNVWEKSNHPTDTLWGDYTGMKLRVTEKGKTPVNYDLVITVSQRHASNDTTLAAVESTRIVNYEIDEATKTVTIIKPIGTDDTSTKLGLDASSFKPTNKNATVTVTKGSGASTGVITGITVIAEDKSKQNYEVNYKIEKIFEEFGVKDVEVLNEVTETESTTKGQVNMTVKIPYGTKTNELIPTFTTCDTVKTIQANGGFGKKGSDVDLYNAEIGKTTSGVANWAAGDTAADQTEAGNHAALTEAKTFTIKVRTGVSSNWDTSVVSTGDVVVTFIPVKNHEALLKGMKVSTEDATNKTETYNQVVQNIDGTYPTIYVGDVSNDVLSDKENENNSAAVVTATDRSVKLYVSADSKVTFVNPYEGYAVGKIKTVATDGTGDPATGATSFEQITVENRDSNGNYAIEFTDLNLREFYSDYMHIKVESEDGSNAEDYFINFRGTPSGDPEVYSVTLHGKSGVADATGTKNSDGDVIIHVPYDVTLIDNATMQTALAGKYTHITVEASSGTTVAAIDLTGNANPVHTATPVTEKSPIGLLGSLATTYTGFGTVTVPAGCKFYSELHTSYSSDIADGAACSLLADGEFETRVFIVVDPASTNAVIDNIKLTNKTTLLETYNEVYEGEIDADNKTIRIEVPFSFGKTNGVYATQDIYVHDWEFNGTHATRHNGTVDVKTGFPADFTELDTQNRNCLLQLPSTAITTIAGEATFDYKTNGKKIKVWSEADGTSANITSAVNETDTYYLYAVRQPANDAHELLNVTSTDPKVTVARDTAVDNLNRWIISVPENYDSQNGVSQAPEFELIFDRSEKSTVKNGNNTWVAADKTGAAFKVAGGSLYFKNEKVAVTDGRVIHFTVVAEDGRATGEYEFVIDHAEPSDDATLKSVKVDDEISFTQDGDKFIVEDLSENENYDVTKLPVVIETNDPGATVTVDGKAYKFDSATGTSNITVDLSEGKTAEVVVTAADEVTTATYTLSMKDGSAPVEKPSDKYTDLDKVTNDTMRNKVKA